jgi:hypothetical protein
MVAETRIPLTEKREYRASTIRRELIWPNRSEAIIPTGFPGKKLASVSESMC